MCYVVVQIVHLFISQVKNYISITPTHVLQKQINGLISRCTVHGRRPLDENKICHFFLCDPSSVTPAKLYIQKYIVMMETSIYDFYTSFYIQEIQKLAFHMPHVRIIETHNYVNTRREAFKCCSSF